VLLIADINTLWRSLPFEALAAFQPVLGLAPMDELVALRCGRKPWGKQIGIRGSMKTLSVVLPPRWASVNAPKAMRKLWTAAMSFVRTVGEEPTGLVVTSPHYACLVELVSDSLPTFYYCADDYLNYAGWDAVTIRKQEAAIFRSVRHSFFVSSALRARAENEYGVDPAKTSVSMNATEERFLAKLPANEIEALRKTYPKLKRPIVGVVGGINERLDFTLLLKLVDLPHLGTLLFVGPVSVRSSDGDLKALRIHPKTMWVGPKPHDELASWHQMLDVALIPYRKSEFNRFCSPLRLFDHLASGRPTIATDNCPQVLEFSKQIRIAKSHGDFVTELADIVRKGSMPDVDTMRSVASKHTWEARASAMHACIQNALRSRAKSALGR